MTTTTQPTLSYATEKSYPFPRLAIAALLFAAASFLTFSFTLLNGFRINPFRFLPGTAAYYAMSIIPTLLLLFLYALGIVLLITLPRRTSIGRIFAAISIALAGTYLLLRLLSLFFALYSYYVLTRPGPALRHIDTLQIASNTTTLLGMLVATTLLILAAIFLHHIAKRDRRHMLAFTSITGLGLCAFIQLVTLFVFILFLTEVISRPVVPNPFTDIRYLTNIALPALSTLTWLAIAILVFTRPRPTLA